MAPRVNGASGKLERTTDVIDANSTYTLMCWVYLVNYTSSSSPFLMALSDNSTSNIDAFIGRSGLAVQCRVTNGGTNTSTTGTTTLSTATWYHIAITRESATSCKIYVNGVLEATNTRTVSGRATITRNELGGAPTTNSAQARYFGIKAWTAALTAGEILSEMRTLKPVRYANLYEFWPGLPGAGFRGKGFSGKGRSWTESGTITDEAPHSIGWGLSPSRGVKSITIVTLSGTVAGTSSTPDASISITRNLEGTVTGTSSTPDASISITRNLSGAVTGTSNAPDASFGGSTVTLSGSVTGTSSTPDASTLIVTRSLEAVVSGTSNAPDASTLTVIRALEGSVTGVSSAADASLSITRNLAGTVSGTSTATDATWPVILYTGRVRTVAEVLQAATVDVAITLPSIDVEVLTRRQ